MSFLVSTMNDAPGYRVQAVLGEVTGLTVRARNVGTRSAPLQGVRRRRAQGSDQAAAGDPRRGDAADGRGCQARGANAVLAMRFDANEVSNGYQEIVAYGTAVVIVQAV